jgi:hypothetical protein
MHIDNKTYVSPNFNDRPSNMHIDAIVVHSTEGAFDSDAEWLCSPKSEVSTHYVIAPDGVIYCLVNIACRAWHAGETYYAGRDDWNDFSIGIEISHQQGEKYTQAASIALTELSLFLINQYPITSELIVMHRWVATPAGRKIDATDFDDSDFQVWKNGLYSTRPPVDPLKVRTIAGYDRDYYCGVGFHKAYYSGNGFWWGGYPITDERRAIDAMGKNVTHMDFQRFRLKYDAIEGVRTALTTDTFTDI